MKFRFRLDRLRRVRTIEERAARAAWATAERDARAAETALDEHRSVVDRARADALSPIGGTLDPRGAEIARGTIDGLLHGLLGRKEAMLTARGQASRLADAWRGREASRRALEELKKRHQARHRREEERIEAQAMDEVALARRKHPESDSSPARPAADEGGSGSLPRLK